MKLLTLGLHYETAPIEVREKLSFIARQIWEGLQEVQHLGGISEAVIVSTCNRVEVYAAVEDEKSACEQIIAFLARFHNVPSDDFRSYLYCHSGKQAVEHLFSVAAGLHSMLLGEAQIQGQVKQAFEHAQNQKTAGELLTHLFQNALTVGKRVRCETAIGKGCVSVSQAAVELILQSVENTTDLNALIVGTGKMSMLAAKAFLKHGINMVIVNRTRLHAVTL